MGAFTEPSFPGHRGDTVGGKPPPPMVTSVQQAGAMAVFEQDSSANRAIQEGSGAKEMAPGRGGGEGGHVQGLQHVWMTPVDGDLFQIVWEGDLGSGR